MEQVKALLKKLGLPTEAIEQVTGDKAKDFDIAETVKAYNASQKEHYQDLFKNDQDYKTEIEKGVKGKLFGAFRNDIKKRFDLGLSNSELQNMEPHELLEIAAKSKGDDKGKGKGEIEQLQAENVQLKNDLTTLKEVEIPKIESRVAQEIDQVKAESKTRSFLAKLSENKELVPEVGSALNVVKLSLATKYDVRVIDDGVELYEKGTDLQKRAQGTIDGKEKFLSLDDAIKGECFNFGFIRKNTNGGEQDNPGGETATIKVKEGTPKKVAKAVDKAAARLAEMQQRGA